MGKKWMSKGLACLLALCLCLALLPTAAWAADGTLTGSGTADDPYQIADAADLAAFRDKVNSGDTDAWAVLTADIDLKGDAENPWTPIGSSYGSRYTGTFDGGTTPSAGCISTTRTGVRTIRALWDIWARAASSKI